MDADLGVALFKDRYLMNCFVEVNDGERNWSISIYSSQEKCFRDYVEWCAIKAHLPKPVDIAVISEQICKDYIFSVNKQCLNPLFASYQVTIGMVRVLAIWWNKLS